MSFSLHMRSGHKGVIPFPAFILSVLLLLLTACTAETGRKSGAITLPSSPQQTASIHASETSADFGVADKIDQTKESTPLTDYFGGDRAVADVPTSTQTQLQYDNRRGVDLAFVDADIRRVVDAILGDILKLNYTVDEGVKGTITLRSARPIARNSLVPALESALAASDIAIVRDGNVMRVVPFAKAQVQAQRRAPVSQRERAMPGYAVEIMPVRYTSVKELEKILATVARKEAILQVDEARNQLVIAGTAQERAAIRATVERFDVDWMRGMSFALYKLENVEPAALITDLNAILKSPLDLLSRVRLVPLPRLRSVLGISARRSDLQQLEVWVRRLDTGTASADRKLHFYNVQNGRARDLAQSLQLVLSGGNFGGQNGYADSAASGLIQSVTGTPTLSPSIDTGGQNNGGASAQIQQNQLRTDQSLLSPGSAQSGNVPTGDTARIVPDEPNNALLIFASASEYAVLQDILKKMDVPPRQVMIEAILAEVTLNDDLRYGLQWFVDTGDGNVTLSESGSLTPGQALPGFSVLYTGINDARLVLNALQSKTNVKVLSSPKLMVLNNQTATLQVGDQVPIITQSAQGVSSPGAPIVNTVSLKDTGVILKVTPRVNDSGLVILDVAQEVSDVAPTTTSGIDSPTIQQRKFSSTVATKSGNTVALGGLIRESVSRSKGGVPFLSQIPGIGAAFGRNTNNGRRTELIVLLTPTVIRDPAETGRIVEEMLDVMDGIEPLVRKGQQDLIRHAPIDGVTDNNDKNDARP
jgi:general secretion pathway protein D